MMRSLLSLSLALAALASFAPSAQAKLDYDKKVGPITLRPGMGEFSNTELGEHYRIFVVEKNVKRENQLVVFSELDENCNFKRDRHEDRISFDFYWWENNRQYFKNPSPLARPYLKDEFKVTGSGANGSFSIESDKINKLDRADTGGAPDFTVKAEKKNGKCEVNAYITIKGKTIVVNSLYAHGEKAGLMNTNPAVCKIIINQGEATEVLLNGDRNQPDNGYAKACKISENAR